MNTAFKKYHNPQLRLLIKNNNDQWEKLIPGVTFLTERWVDDTHGLWTTQYVHMNKQFLKRTSIKQFGYKDEFYEVGEIKIRNAQKYLKWLENIDYSSLHSTSKSYLTRTKYIIKRYIEEYKEWGKDNIKLIFY